jgi:hypothetical protein
LPEEGQEAEEELFEALEEGAGEGEGVGEVDDGLRGEDVVEVFLGEEGFGGFFPVGVSVWVGMYVYVYVWVSDDG